MIENAPLYIYRDVLAHFQNHITLLRYTGTHSNYMGLVILQRVKNGHIRRVVDDDVKSLVLEIAGTNVATTYITCPIQPRASLGVQLPFLVMVIKNMKRYFTFEIQILDDKDMRRRFRVSNFQSSTKVLPFCTTMPIGLSEGWNQVQFNLADFTKRAYGSTYMETTRVQIHANVRIRRIYFSDRLYSDDDMPNEFKLFTSVGKPKEVPEKKISKSKLSTVEEMPVKKSMEKSADEPPPTTPMGPEDMSIKVPPPDIALPSPVDTGAVTPSEVEIKENEPEAGEAPSSTEKTTEGGIPGEGTEPPTDEGGEGAMTEEGGEAMSPAEPTETTEETIEQATTEATEEASAEPATTEEAPTTEEPAPTDDNTTEGAATEEPAPTEEPTEPESEPPPE